MGSCLSCSALYSSTTVAAANNYSVRKSKIMVITTDGSLQVYTTRLTVADVLAGAGADGVIICDAENIVFDAFPTATPPEAELEVGKLYFILTAAESGERITGGLLAAMAMKARTALREAEEKQGRRIGRPRVMPLAGNGDGEIISFCKGKKETKKKKKKKSYWEGRRGRLKRMLSAVHEVEEE